MSFRLVEELPVLAREMGITDLAAFRGSLDIG
jgi:hypothetical protein